MSKTRSLTLLELSVTEYPRSSEFVSEICAVGTYIDFFSTQFQHLSTFDILGNMFFFLLKGEIIKVIPDVVITLLFNQKHNS